jgi:hypothetical protein
MGPTVVRPACALPSSLLCRLLKNTEPASFPKNHTRHGVCFEIPARQQESIHEPRLTQHSNPSEPSMTLETIISVGVLGWLAMGMVLMGLGIW